MTTPVSTARKPGLGERFLNHARTLPDIHGACDLYNQHSQLIADVCGKTGLDEAALTTALYLRDEGFNSGYSAALSEAKLIDEDGKLTDLGAHTLFYLKTGMQGEPAHEPDPVIQALVELPARHFRPL